MECQILYLLLLYPHLLHMLQLQNVCFYFMPTLNCFFCIKFWHVHMWINFCSYISFSSDWEPQTFRADSVTSFTALSIACMWQGNQGKSITRPTFLFGSFSEVFLINSFRESPETNLFLQRGFCYIVFRYMRSCWCYSWHRSLFLEF